MKWVSTPMKVAMTGTAEKQSIFCFEPSARGRLDGASGRSLVWTPLSKNKSSH